MIALMVVLAMYAVLVFSTTITSIIEGVFMKVVQSPSKIYETSKLNWFGVIMLWLLWVFLFPINYICYIVWWIFHAGRDDGSRNGRSFY